MTSSDLIFLASRNGVIFWPKSRTYETLSLVDGKVIAQGLTTKPHSIILRTSYTCVEVDPNTKVPVEELLRPATISIEDGQIR